MTEGGYYYYLRTEHLIYEYILKTISALKHWGLVNQQRDQPIDISKIETSNLVQTTYFRNNDRQLFSKNYCFNH
jgi:hypothetical protein